MDVFIYTLAGLPWKWLSDYLSAQTRSQAGSKYIRCLVHSDSSLNTSLGHLCHLLLDLSRDFPPFPAVDRAMNCAFQAPQVSRGPDYEQLYQTVPLIFFPPLESKCPGCSPFLCGTLTRLTTFLFVTESQLNEGMRNPPELHCRPP